LASGPDGALYVVDMYRGLIEYGAYVTPYLREQTVKRKLDQPINRGRIWRIVSEDWKPSKPKKISDSPSEELIRTLLHPNGWYRDIAQRLLVERGNKNISQPLTDAVLKGDNVLSRLHALWTMEGLNLISPDLLFKLTQDHNLLVRTTAVRLLEPIANKNKNVRKKFGQELLKIVGNAPIEQTLQITLAANVLDQEISHQLLEGIVQRFDTSALMRDAVLSSLQNQEFAFLQRLWKLSSWQRRGPASEIFFEMLTTSIVRNGDAGELTSILSMLQVKDSFDWKDKAVLTGISIQAKNTKIKPIRLPSAPRLLTRPDTRNAQTLLQALSVMFEWPGHVVDTNAQTQNRLSASEQKDFVLGRQFYLTTCAGCHGTDGAGLNRFAPPLIGSDWVLGDKRRLVLLVLHGIEGPMEVKGKVYDAPDILPVMPAHSTLDDGSISSILTYIRNEWGNTADAVSRGLVGTTRHTSQGRVTPWTAAELNKHILELKATGEK
jgi:mono/diheme cytochrome c family protein